jgi:ribosomal protein S18 acetylase RimI-like enzyme
MKILATATRRHPIALRPITSADAPFLRDLYATTRAEELRPVPWTDEEKRRFCNSQFAAQTAHYEEHYPGCAFSIVELEGRPIGRLYVHRGDDDIRVVDNSLGPEVRGCGIGGTLMADILAEGDATAKSVSIHVEHFNPALRLYDRLGFRHVDTYGVYHLMEWQPVVKGPSWTSPR